MCNFRTFSINLALFIWGTALPALAAECTGQDCLQNPLKFPSIEKFIEGVLQAIVIIALPIITVFIVWAGFLYISARGNAGQIERAHQNFKWVLIGTILILSAWVLATLIGGTVRQLLG
ncbi:MAG: pilin [Patescibacteria group bacterium]